MKFSWKGEELHRLRFKYTWVHVQVHRSELARRGVPHPPPSTRVNRFLPWNFIASSKNLPLPKYYEKLFHIESSLWLALILFCVPSNLIYPRPWQEHNITGTNWPSDMKNVICKGSHPKKKSASVWNFSKRPWPPPMCFWNHSRNFF